VVAPGLLVARALELASLAARNSPAAIEASKRAVYAALETGQADGLRQAWRLVRDHWKHPDHAEGMNAFAERREPDWAAPRTSAPAEPTAGKA
jgi:enoyl-CoA hydratase/carnithine racemase